MLWVSFNIPPCRLGTSEEVLEWGQQPHSPPPPLSDEFEPPPVFGKKDLVWEEDAELYSKFIDRKVRSCSQTMSPPPNPIPPLPPLPPLQFCFVFWATNRQYSGLTPGFVFTFGGVQGSNLGQQCARQAPCYNLSSMLSLHILSFFLCAYDLGPGRWVG